MTIETAIKLAIEGGWNPWPTAWGLTKFINSGNIRSYWRNPITLRQVSISTDSILLDPQFWQALGKSCGWDKKKWRDRNDKDWWLPEWHMLIDHLAEGGTIESYFNTLEEKK